METKYTQISNAKRENDTYIDAFNAYSLFYLTPPLNLTAQSGSHRSLLEVIANRFLIGIIGIISKIVPTTTLHDARIK